MIEWVKTYKDKQSILETSLRIGNLFAPNRLTEMELLIVAYMLRHYPPGINFRETGVRAKIIQYFRFSKSGMSTHFRNLHKKKWMVNGRLDASVESFRDIDIPVMEIKVVLTYEHSPGTKRA